MHTCVNTSEFQLVQWKVNVLLIKSKKEINCGSARHHTHYSDHECSLFLLRACLSLPRQHKASMTFSLPRSCSGASLFLTMRSFSPFHSPSHTLPLTLRFSCPAHQLVFALSCSGSNNYGGMMLSLMESLETLLVRTGSASRTGACGI